jgi:hypothetical protein
MAGARIIDFEVAKAARMPPVRFGSVAHTPGVVEIDITGRFTPGAARILAKHLLERADAAEAEAKR